MKREVDFKNINWSILILVILIAVITISMSFYDLYHPATTSTEDNAQSRIDLRWSFIHTIFSMAIILISTFLTLAWKRIFPFNIPITIILVGLCYALFFLSFTAGWVAIQGLLGFIIALLIGLILTIIYSVSIFVGRMKANKKNTIR